jgi:hypothetical protein
LTRCPAFALALAAAALAPAAAGAEELLRGPHPFGKDNELAVLGGYGTANSFDGVRAGVAYGFQAAGSLWLDLRLDFVDARQGPVPRGCPSPDPCAEVATYADVLAGVKYKLRTSIPLVPYGGIAAGPVFLFHDGAAGAFGLATRASAGAQYFLYEWLGLGIELGATLGGAWVPDVPGLQAGLRVFDVGIGAELQF